MMEAFFFIEAEHCTRLATLDKPQPFDQVGNPEWEVLTKSQAQNLLFEELQCVPNLNFGHFPLCGSRDHEWF
jgi:hypothetical protein